MSPILAFHTKVRRSKLLETEVSNQPWETNTHARTHYRY